MFGVVSHFAVLVRHTQNRKFEGAAYVDGDNIETKQMYKSENSEKLELLLPSK